MTREIKPVLQGCSNEPALSPPARGAPQDAIDDLNPAEPANAVYEIEILEQAVVSETAASFKYFTTYKNPLVAEWTDPESGAEIRGARDRPEQPTVVVKAKPKGTADHVGVGKGVANRGRPPLGKPAIDIREEQDVPASPRGAMVELPGQPRRLRGADHPSRPAADGALDNGHGPIRTAPIHDDQFRGRIATQGTQEPANLARLIEYRKNQRYGIPIA